MEIDSITPIQYPPGYEEGPWGVCSVGMYWWVVDKDTLDAQQIGVIGKQEVLSQALEEAARRNAQLISVASQPQSQAAADVKEVQVVSLNSPKG